MMSLLIRFDLDLKKNFVRCYNINPTRNFKPSPFFFYL